MAKPLGLSMGVPKPRGVDLPTIPGKFRVSLVVGFKPRTMCHLLGPHFPVFALTNWATLAGNP